MLLRNLTRHAFIVFAIVLGLCAGGQLTSAADPDKAGPEKESVAQQSDDGDAANRRWLGIMFAPVSEQLRAHIDLPEEQGLLVARVMPDSPAADAGVKQHDIVVQAGEAAVASIEDIKDVMEGMDEGQDVDLQVLRGGKSRKVTVKVGTAPKSWPYLGEGAGRIRPEAGDVEQLRKWVDALGRGRAVDGSPRMRFFGPEIRVETFLGGREFPEDLSVTVTKQGRDPAKVTVKRGDEKWEVTEDQLDQLSDDIRPHVRRFLGQGWNMRDFRRFELPGGIDREKTEPEVDKRLNDVEERLRGLIDELRDLRRERARPRRGNRERKDPDTDG